MNKLCLAILVVTLAAGGSALAADRAVLTLGGAPSVPRAWGAEVPHVSLYKDGNLSAGLASGLRPGGYLAWNGDNWRLETSLGFGVAWGGDRFTLSTASPFSLESPETNLGLTMRINQAVTPNLSISGSAEAQHSLNSNDSSVSSNQLLLGARLGLRF